MANLNVTEYAAMAQVAGAQMPQEPKLAAYQIPLNVGSTQGPVLQKGTRFVELTADAAYSFEIGTNPTAVGTARRMPANSITFRGVPENGSFIVAAIQNT